MISKPFIILGPTAVGKTALALELAKRVPAEIISMDSMQIYAGMDIGTAKPSKEELQAVPHHLVSTHSLLDFSDVASYLGLVRKSQEEIKAKGKLPVLVGGTAMYIKNLTQGLFDGPSADESIRGELKALLAEKGPQYLHGEVLAKCDPVSALRLHPNDTLRVIRAIEVWRLTGKALSEQSTQWENHEGGELEYRLIGLAMPRDLLYARIEERVDRMLEKGLLEEVRSLKEKGLEKNRRAAAAIGYKEILGFLNGEYGYERAVELLKRNTRRFAKHQLTWFRHMPEIEWHDVVKEPNLGLLAEMLVKKP